MRSLVILGAGTAGTMMLNKLARELPAEEWKLTIVDRDENHIYQPGLLFIPFEIYEPADVVKPRREFLPDRAEFVIDEIERVDVDTSDVLLKSGRTLHYDVLIVATGTAPYPEETPGMDGDLWYRDAFDFYTYDGAVALLGKLKDWQGGRLVINLAESIFKCPVAPLEFAFLADSYFKKKGMRDKVELRYVTPLAGAFTKPKASEVLTHLLEKKGVTVVPDFYLERVDEETKTLVAYDGREEPFDLLVSVPVNMGAAWVATSGLGDADDLRFIPVDKQTLQSKAAPNMFVIGDAAALPTSKAGSVAHFSGDVLIENVLAFIEGKPLPAKFDGHANCFIETGGGKATLVDFNYDVEPLPGMYPLPVVGPMSLLKETRMNHMGKLGFKWIYWHILLTGKSLPVSNDLSMSGKKQNEIVTG